ncbi:MAG TPA: hypothetical protein VFX20_19980 [Steroidobacteraceae bacterium]|nr:hypothetical protein [Steroidobacteraceae bacterium]
MKEQLLRLQARLLRQVERFENDGSNTALDAAVILTDACEALEKLLARAELH